MDLIVFPFVDLKKCQVEGFRTRDAHLIEELSKDDRINSILVIDRPISIVEILFKRRWWKVKGGDVLYQHKNACLTRLSPKVYVLDIIVLDVLTPVVLKHAWITRIFSNKKIQKYISDAINYLSLSDYGLFAFSPLAYPVLGGFNEKYSVFFAVDNWLEHPQLSSGKKVVEIGYEKFKKNADVIITTSHKLSDFFDRAQKKVFTVFNGVDKERFKCADYGVPHDLVSIKARKVGYAGKIQERLDIELVKYLAADNEDVVFVFIGEVTSKRHFDELKGVPNVIYLGDKHYDDLPKYLCAFDLCIIPHVINCLSESMSPLKLYEYLAADKDVVTTSVSGLEDVTEKVVIARNKEEFSMAIKNRLAAKSSKAFDVPYEWSWRAKCDKILSIVTTTVKLD